MNPAEDRFRIIEVVDRYATAADSRDWALLDEIFLPNVSGDFGAYQPRDIDGVREMLRANLDGCGPTQHLLGNYRIELNGDRARSCCSVRAFHAGTGATEGLTYELFGEYRDELVRTPQGWRISHRAMKISHELGSRDVLRPAT